MADWSFLLIGLFLPLFPMSMVFNRVFARVTQPHARAVLLLLWPLAGLGLADRLGPDIPAFVMAWALATAALYALRLLELRELGTWTGFIATSIWALLWIPLGEQVALREVVLATLGFSTPLAVLMLVALLLRQRLGGTYAGLNGGIATCLPRLSVALVVTLLAVIATPPFPGFFSLLSILMLASPSLAVGLLLVWLLWSWAAARMIHGFVVGAAADDCVARDISVPAGWGLAAVFTALVLVGVTFTGGLA